MIKRKEVHQYEYQLIGKYTIEKFLSEAVNYGDEGYIHITALSTKYPYSSPLYRLIQFSKSYTDMDDPISHPEEGKIKIAEKDLDTYESIKNKIVVSVSSTMTEGSNIIFNINYNADQEKSIQEGNGESN